VHSTHAELDAAGKAVPVGGPYPEDMQEGGGRRRRYALAVQDVNNVDPDNPDPPRGTQTQPPDDPDNPGPPRGTQTQQPK